MPPDDDILDLSGNVAWITGASRGIGLACARLLAAHGVRVVGLDLEISDELSECAEATEVLDVSDFAAAEAVDESLAGRGLAPDILVNNAGITRDAVLWKLTEEQWDTVLDVNLKGAFNLTRLAAKRMRAAGGGSIINMTSINGLRGKFGQSNYSAAKAGLVGLTKAAARDLGRFGVRVNAVAPGMIETEMVKGLDAEVKQKAVDESLLGKLGTPEDIARAVLFLAGGLSGHVTGQVLQVDGGQYL